MSEINYQALREVAEAAKGDTTWQNLQAFHAAATPEVVQALLDENERLCRDLIARNGEIEGLREWAEELEAREVALPVASCIVEDGCMCVDGFSEYVGHSLSDGMHELYAAPPASVVPEGLVKAVRFYEQVSLHRPANCPMVWFLTAPFIKTLSCVCRSCVITGRHWKKLKNAFRQWTASRRIITTAVR
nr:MAG TPA: Ead/Ea22-like protein [Caudoviricetes sp.]